MLRGKEIKERKNRYAKLNRGKEDLYHSEVKFRLFQNNDQLMPLV